MRRTSAHCLLVLSAFCALTSAGCTAAGESRPDDGQDAAVIEPETAANSNAGVVPTGSLPNESGSAEDEQSPCLEPVEEAAHWLDRSQERVYKTVCGTTAWFDGFFGSNRYDAEYGNTYGRMGISGFWDQYDGFDPTLRLRAKIALPALKNRTALMIGRGDEKDFIEERETPSDSIPSNFNRVEDDSFLIGLGYRRGTGLKRGFSLSVGAKIRAPPEPYAKARYRRAWELNDSTLLQLRPIGYWKSEEGFGSTLHVEIDHLLSDQFMLRWTSSGNVSEDEEIEGLAWTNWMSLYQALADRRAISYHAFVQGETKADIKTQNYGVEVRYRRRIARQWLFLEIIGGVSWPRYFIDEERDINFGIGAGFEMYFGPVPDIQMR